MSAPTTVSTADLAAAPQPDGASPLATRGFDVLEDLVSAGDARTLRDAILAEVAAIAPPALYAPELRAIGDDVAITSTGLALSRLLARRPQLAPLVLATPLVGAMRAALGADARLELAGAVVTDRARPFFSWHTHIDGLEESARARAGAWPAVPDVRRVLTLLYLDDLDDDTGPLLVLPRRAGEPTAPPHALDAPSWRGELVLRPRAGTLVALDQCTWHAARAMSREGPRVFVGCYFAAAHATPAPWADDTLRDRLAAP